MKKRLLIGMSGASGAPLTIELLRQLQRDETVETHLIMTKGAQMTLRQETDLIPEQVKALADVTLKENRKLVLIARESPLSTIHLRNMYELSRMGAVIMPPMLTYYHHPQSVEECTVYAVQRILRQLGMNEETYEWEGI